MKRIVIISFILVIAFFWAGRFVLAEDKAGNAYGFSFEIADKQGNKKSTIQGEKANFLQNGLIELSQLKAILHRDKDINIITKSAVFDRSKDEVFTREFVEIFSPAMKISGTGGKWHSVKNEVVLNKEVKVILLNEKSQPETVITGEGKMEVFFNQDVAYLEDNVVITNKDGKLKSDKAKFFFMSAQSETGTEIEKMDAMGNVRIFFEDKVANSEKAQYFVSDGKLVLTDDPRIKQSGSLYTAEKITIYPREDRVEFEPNAQLIIDY